MIGSKNKVIFIILIDKMRNSHRSVDKITEEMSESAPKESPSKALHKFLKNPMKRPNSLLLDHYRSEASLKRSSKEQFEMDNSAKRPLPSPLKNSKILEQLDR